MSGIRIEGAETLTRRLNELANIDFAGISRSIAEGLRSSTIDRFQDGKAPDEKKWTASIRARQEGGVTLQDNGILKNSIKSESSEKDAAIGTNLEYAATHQFGDERTIRAKSNKGLRFKVAGKFVTKKKVNVKIPARPFLGISDEDKKEIKSVLDDAIRG